MKQDDNPNTVSNTVPEIVDPAILGLERKLDVLRAQLAACRAGEDPGEAGVLTWSRLEDQSQRIDRLVLENLTLIAERDAALEALASSDKNAADRERKLNSLRRDAAGTRAELERAREEIRIGQRTNIALGRAINIALALNRDITPPCEAAAKAKTISADALMLEAILSSTSWRITAPLRSFGRLAKHLRQALRG